MEVIWLLDGNTLSGLRRATQRSSGGGLGGRARVSLEAFVTEFYRALCFGSSGDHGVKGRSQAKTRQLVERICVLFDLVDVDSAGVIDWVDFTDFCVYIRGRDSGNQGLEDDSGALTSEQKRVQDSDITRFTEKLGYIDRSSHCHEVGSPSNVFLSTARCVLQSCMNTKACHCDARKQSWCANLSFCAINMILL